MTDHPAPPDPASWHAFLMVRSRRRRASPSCSPSPRRTKRRPTRPRRCGPTPPISSISSLGARHMASSRCRPVLKPSVPTWPPPGSAMRCRRCDDASPRLPVPTGSPNSPWTRDIRDRGTADIAPLPPCFRRHRNRREQVEREAEQEASHNTLPRGASLCCCAGLIHPFDPGLQRGVEAVKGEGQHVRERFHSSRLG